MTPVSYSIHLGILFNLATGWNQAPLLVQPLVPPFLCRLWRVFWRLPSWGRRRTGWRIVVAILSATRWKG
jgi:hypothetical protein